jgi:hypothetical protein
VAASVAACHTPEAERAVTTVPTPPTLRGRSGECRGQHSGGGGSARPFDALVVGESAALGQLATPQTVLAELVGTDEAWVEAAIVADRLPFVGVGVDGDGALASVRYDAGSLVVWRVGRVVRMLGDVDPEGRMARLLVSTPDPLRPGFAEPAVPSHRVGAPPSSSGGAELPLLLNAWVQVEIRGNRQLEGIELPREYLRGEREVWVFEAGHLDVREVEIAFETHASVFVTDGLAPGEQVVTTAIPAPVSGMPLRREGAPSTLPRMPRRPSSWRRRAADRCSRPSCTATSHPCSSRPSASRQEASYFRTGASHRSRLRASRRPSSPSQCPVSRAADTI